jgi:streptogramin lyase
MAARRACLSSSLIAVLAMIPATNAAAAITEYPIPTAGGNPQHIVAGPDDALWFTELSAGKVGRLETDGTVTEFPLPNPGSWPTAIAAGPDGALWFGQNRGGKIGRITTAGDVTEFPLTPSTEYQPGIATAFVNGITAAPDGALWFTQGHRVNSDEGEAPVPAKIGRITTSGEITYYPLPRIASNPVDITTGPDGALWFTEQGGTDPVSGEPTPNRIGRMTTAGALTDFVVPWADNGPHGIVSGPDGALWFTDFQNNAIGRITVDGTFSEEMVAPLFGEGGGVSHIAAGADGSLWFTLSFGGLGSVTTTGDFERYLVPSGGNTNGITVGPDDHIWFTEPQANKIGRVDEAEPIVPALTMGGSALPEGDAGTVTAQFAVNLHPPTDETVTVDYGTSDGNAISPADYQGVSGTLTFGPGDSSEIIEVTVNGDALDEDDETFTVTLSDPQLATINGGTATGTIMDDDPRPTISIADSPGRSEGGPALSFQVTLSGPSGRQVQVNYATQNGSAKAPGDYGSKTGTLTFVPGHTSRVVLVNSVEDALDEENESLAVRLSSPIAATIADSIAGGSIVDDDPTPSLSISDAANRREGGPPHRFTVTLSAASARQVTVDYATVRGTALGSRDYMSAAGTLSFAPGQTVKTVSVTNIDDALDEPPESFSVRLSGPSAATIADAVGATAIIDND